MAETIRRKVARKLLISDILSATYIKRPGWEPSGILTKYGEVARLDIIGVIVSISKEENNASLLVDDGSGNITLRFFDEHETLNNLSLGDLVMVIGKPREWESSKYIVPEIIKKLDDKKWFNVHQLEIKLQKKTNPVKLPVDIADAEAKDIETGPYQKILNAIAILDKGSGVDIQEIVNNVQVTNCENIVNSLIEEGEIFEISPGKVKLLE